MIESAGTAELAKHAVDVAAHQAVDEAGEAKTGVARSDDETPSTDAQARLAQMLGYASYLDLMESSKSAGSSRQRNWLVTADVDGHWALWNDADLEVVARFESHQEAVEAAATAIPKANPKAKLTPKSPSQSADL
ncbi:MAG TPA: hypothetical protein VHX65_07795 [Pirellulales bacterium]|nr:hypothetical protein [Pirellulales bacterium]